MLNKKNINIKVLKGEPLDGSGKVCIHLFVIDENGLFTEPHVIHPMYDENGKEIKQQVECKPAKGRLACDSTKNPHSYTKNGVTYITFRSDDPRAVTCPKCIASKEYINISDRIKGLIKP